MAVLPVLYNVVINPEGIAGVSDLRHFSSGMMILFSFVSPYPVF
jgi:hypothetical protein